jgi:hypothetical protein
MVKLSNLSKSFDGREKISQSMKIINLNVNQNP